MSEGLNLAAIHEAIAGELPDRECIVFRDRRLTWAQVTDRSRRLADLLRHHGLGCHRERSVLAGHESGQDHVALYLHNGNEYLEGMLGAMKARAASFNVNYRYLDEELLYLFRDADARAVLFHGCFAPVLDRLRAQLPGVRLWLQVEDGSGELLLPGALTYEAALAGAEPAAPGVLSPDDLYVLYTGGTTGMPKGVLWRQDDIFHGAMAPSRPPRSLEDVRERARSSRRGIRALPTPPLMHGAAQWVAFAMWNVGGTIVFPSRPERFDADDVWDTVEREGVEAMTIVGDAFARPLLESLAVRSRDLSTLRQISSGGAILSPETRRALLARLPGIRILDVLGSSESGSQAVRTSTGEGHPGKIDPGKIDRGKTDRGESEPDTGDFELAAGNLVLNADCTAVLPAGSPETGWLARRGRMPLGYLGDAEKTARTFPVLDGVRYAVPGDRAWILADGALQLLGRDSVTINTGGEKVFAEEVELALKGHADVWDCLVVGTPHPRWGQQVVALVQPRTGSPLAAGDGDALALLRAEGARHLTPYKRPKELLLTDEIVRSPSGKPDYAWARERARALLATEG